MLNFEKLLSLIKFPLITEKTVNLYENQQYTFVVCKSLTKTQLKFIFETFFKINIIKINTSILPIKKHRVKNFIGKRSAYKKVCIKLQKGQIIKELVI